MPRILKNAIQKRWTFTLTFADGRTQDVEVVSESYHSAVYGLPRFDEVGKYKYKLKSKTDQQ